MYKLAIQSHTEGNISEMKLKKIKQALEFNKKID